MAKNFLYFEVVSGPEGTVGTKITSSGDNLLQTHPTTPVEYEMKLMHYSISDNLSNNKTFQLQFRLFLDSEKIQRGTHGHGTILDTQVPFSDTGSSNEALRNLLLDENGNPLEAWQANSPYFTTNITNVNTGMNAIAYYTEASSHNDGDDDGDQLVNLAYQTAPFGNFSKTWAHLLTTSEANILTNAHPVANPSSAQIQAVIDAVTGGGPRELARFKFKTKHNFISTSINIVASGLDANAILNGAGINTNTANISFTFIEPSNEIPSFTGDINSISDLRAHLQSILTSNYVTKARLDLTNAKSQTGATSNKGEAQTIINNLKNGGSTATLGGKTLAELKTLIANYGT